MFRAMALEGVLGKMGRSDNAMKKRSKGINPIFICLLKGAYNVLKDNETITKAGWSQASGQ